MIKYSRQFVTPDDENAVLEVMRSEYLTRGPVTKKLEEKLSEIAGKKYCVACANGTLALNAAGSVTYKVKANAALYNVLARVGTPPNFLLVEDIGPS